MNLGSKRQIITEALTLDGRSPGERAPKTHHARSPVGPPARDTHSPELSEPEARHGGRRCQATATPLEGAMRRPSTQKLGRA